MISASRRNFLNRLLTAPALPIAFPLSAMTQRFNPGFTVLFQGDSITDGNRGRSNDPNHILGHGYAFSVASDLGSKYPDRGLSFINRGISGDKVADLLNRWQADTLALKPDLISILVGVNDILKIIGDGGGLEATGFEKQYRELIAITRRELPDSVLVIGEPFILPAGMVNKDRERWEYLAGTAGSIAATLAHDNNAIFLPYQKTFSDAAKKVSAEYWIWDGIHPTYSGHGLMKDLWIREVARRCKELK